jgi:hypothetical protein
MANNNGNQNVVKEHAPEPDIRPTTKAATGYVVVACKIPNGIVLQNSVMHADSEPVMGGGHRDIKTGRKLGAAYTVKGPSVKWGELPKFIFAGGYALTPNIPEDFWNEWVRQNPDAEILQKKLIFAFRQMDDVEAECRNNETILSGLEPLDPQRLPMRNVQTAPEQKAPIR